jgi:hypothetical protein
MKRHNDQYLLDFAFALLDHRSEAFRQKMLKHFQSTGRKLWTDVEKIPGRKKNDPVSPFQTMSD